MIAGYAGTPTWVMGVDGDEVYDPGRLGRLRPDLLAGRYDGSFQVMGNVLNVRRLEPSRQVAHGYLAPPCRSMVKLYNFNAIEAWPPPCPERLHGGVITYRPGYGRHCALPAPRARLGPDAAALPAPVLYPPQQPRPLARRAGQDPQRGRRDEALGLQPALLGVLALRPGGHPLFQAPVLHARPPRREGHPRVPSRGLGNAQLPAGRRG